MEREILYKLRVVADPAAAATLRDFGRMLGHPGGGTAGGGGSFGTGGGGGGGGGTGFANALKDIEKMGNAMVEAAKKGQGPLAGMYKQLAEDREAAAKKATAAETREFERSLKDRLRANEQFLAEQNRQEERAHDRQRQRSIAIQNRVERERATAEESATIGRSALEFQAAQSRSMGRSMAAVRNQERTQQRQFSGGALALGGAGSILSGAAGLGAAFGIPGSDALIRSYIGIQAGRDVIGGGLRLAQGTGRLLGTLGGAAAAPGFAGAAGGGAAGISGGLGAAGGGLAAGALTFAALPAAIAVAIVGALQGRGAVRDVSGMFEASGRLSRIQGRFAESERAAAIREGEAGIRADAETRLANRRRSNLADMLGIEGLSGSAAEAGRGAIAARQWENQSDLFAAHGQANFGGTREDREKAAERVNELEQERLGILRDAARLEHEISQDRLQAADRTIASLQQEHRLRGDMIRQEKDSLKSAAERFADLSPGKRQEVIELSARARRGDTNFNRQERQALHGIGLAEADTAATRSAEREALGAGFRNVIGVHEGERRIAQQQQLQSALQVKIADQRELKITVERDDKVLIQRTLSEFQRVTAEHDKRFADEIQKGVNKQIQQLRDTITQGKNATPTGR